MTEQEIRDRLSERDILAATGWGEARGEPIHGQIGVLCIIRNRVKTGRWGTTYKAVCLAPRQFSCWNLGGGPQDEANHAVLLDLASGLILDGRHGAALAQWLWLADGILRGVLQDITSGATHYLTERLYRTAPPKWARMMTVTATLGAHVCLREETRASG